MGYLKENPVDLNGTFCDAGDNLVFEGVPLTTIEYVPSSEVGGTWIPADLRVRPATGPEKPVAASYFQLEDIPQSRPNRPAKARLSFNVDKYNKAADDDDDKETMTDAWSNNEICLLTIQLGAASPVVLTINLKKNVIPCG